MSGFVYIWYDRKHRRFYIGSHWGQEDDGYICSSNWMIRAYRRRPKDFKRRILSRVFSSHKDLIEEENRWLGMIKSDEIKIRYYNLRIAKQGYWFTDERAKMSVSEKIRGKALKNAQDPVYRKKYLEGIKKRKIKDPEAKAKKQQKSMLKTMAEKYPIENRYIPSESQSIEHRKKNSEGGKRAWARLTDEERHLRGCKSGAKQKGTKRLNQFWWNNGHINTRNNICPGIGWIRGKI